MRRHRAHVHPPGPFVPPLLAAQSTTAPPSRVSAESTAERSEEDEVGEGAGCGDVAAVQGLGGGNGRDGTGGSSPVAARDAVVERTGGSATSGVSEEDERQETEDSASKQEEEETAGEHERVAVTRVPDAKPKKLLPKKRKFESASEDEGRDEPSDGSESNSAAVERALRTTEREATGGRGMPGDRHERHALAERSRNMRRLLRATAGYEERNGHRAPGPSHRGGGDGASAAAAPGGSPHVRNGALQLGSPRPPDGGGATGPERARMDRGDEDGKETPTTAGATPRRRPTAAAASQCKKARPYYPAHHALARHPAHCNLTRLLLRHIR